MDNTELMLWLGFSIGVGLAIASTILIDEFVFYILPSMAGVFLATSGTLIIGLRWNKIKWVDE